MTIVRWILALAVGVFLLAFGAMKFTGDNFIFAYIAYRSGIELFEPVIRMLVGAAEMVTGLLIIYPRTRGIGALLAVFVVLGAISFHVSPWLGVNAPTGFAESATQPYDSPDDFAEGAPALFFMACGLAAASIAALVLERRRIFGGPA
jgi:uncharacterized membrane protein YphA (DoxX/SURF4 family)